jgi:hypothetical protein
LTKTDIADIIYTKTHKEKTQMARTINIIATALKTFGIKGKANLEYVQADRIKVSVNGEYFGLWDAEKNTFVD